MQVGRIKDRDTHVILAGRAVTHPDARRTANNRTRTIPFRRRISWIYSIGITIFCCYDSDIPLIWLVQQKIRLLVRSSTDPFLMVPGHTKIYNVNYQMLTCVSARWQERACIPGPEPEPHSRDLTAAQAGLFPGISFMVTIDRNENGSDTVLHVQNLTKTFDRKTVLDTITFDVRRGEVFGLLGPNGAGKTTLIRTILDIFRPDTGEIALFGREFSDDIKDAIGYLPEEGSLDKEILVSECIRYFAELKRVDAIEKKMDEWLEKLDLLEYRNRKIQDLSKGMHRRLQFILSVIHEPDILILDEPFSGLDPLNIRTLKDILLDLSGKGTTLIMSTHQMDEVERMCDRILMLNSGKNVLYGRLDDIRKEFGLSIEVHYEGTLPHLDTVTGINDSGNYAELVVEEDTDTQALLKTLAENVKIRKFEIKQRSMNEIFIEVCRK